MMQPLECIVSSNQIYSPGVGIFIHGRPAGLSDDICYIGTLIRLNERLPLIVPNGVNFRLLLPDGARVMVGDALAEVLDSSENARDSSTRDHGIESPADGFFVCCREDGRSIKLPGDVLNKGDIIAFIEFMKIRMEIVFSGEFGAVFLRYCGTNGRAVRKGETIAEYKIDDTDASNENI